MMHRKAVFLPHTTERPVHKFMVWGLSILIFGVSFWIYFKTLCPTLYWGDSGELVTAAWSLGVAHPPGSPFWCLLAHPFTWLPWGDVAYRVNLSSAFFASLGCVVVYLVSLRVARSTWGALGAALALAFSYSYWNDANVSEVYSLAFCLFALSLLFLCHFLETEKPMALVLAAFTLGLGITVHYLFLIGLPVFVALVLLHRTCIPKRQIVCILSASLVAGLAFFLYLPIRAAADPVLNWGDPVTWGRFWDHVTRAQYQKVSVEVAGLSIPLAARDSWMGTFKGFALHSINLFRMCRIEFGWEFFTLGMLGVTRALVAHRKWGMIGLGTFLFIGSAYGFFDNFSFDPTGQFYRPYVFLFILFACWIACGVGFLIDWAQGKDNRGARPVLSAVLGCLIVIFLPATLVRANYQTLDRSKMVFGRDFAERALRDLPPRSILVSANDPLYFSILYLQEVEGMRPDVSCIMRLRLDQNVYPEQLARVYPHLVLPHGEELEALYRQFRDTSQRGHFRRRGFVARWIEICLNKNISTYPIFWDIGRETIRGFSLVPRGITAQITQPLTPEEWDQNVAEYHEPFWRRYQEEVLLSTAFQRDRDGRRVIALVLNNLALAYVGRARFEDAADLIKKAIQFYPGTAEPYNNLGNIFAGAGQFEEASRLYRKALSLRVYAAPHLGLGRIHHAKGEIAAADAEYREALRLRPRFPEALQMLAQLMSEQGHADEAEDLLRQAQEIQRRRKDHSN